MPPRAIVLAVDQLSRRCLGCYGHEWIVTPNLDRLAACGVVFDQCFASPIAEQPLQDAALSLSERLRGQCVRVRWLSEADDSADGDTDEWSQTSFAELVTQAEDALAELSLDTSTPTPWLLWLESRGIGWPGLATPQFAELYADELHEEIPAELLAIREVEVTYAALLTQFDHLLGQLLATVERLFANNLPLVVLLAAHGEAVGEAEMLAPFADRAEGSPGASGTASSFRDELIHPPLLIAGGSRDALGSRRQELVVPADVLPTLQDWFGLAPHTDGSVTQHSLLPLLRNEEFVVRSEVFLRDAEGHAGVRTEQFLLIQPDAFARLSSVAITAEFSGDDSSSSLFLKPEDVWEVNDVAAQQPDQVDMLREMLRTWWQSCDISRIANPANPED